MLRDDPVQALGPAVEQCVEHGVTAVFAVYDSLAGGLLQAFRAKNIEVPEQMALVGFDDEHYAHLLAPPLTTARQPFEQEGQIAARLVIEQIEGLDATRRVVTLSSELVIRESCGCKPPHNG